MVQLENESAFDFMSRCFDTQEKIKPELPILERFVYVNEGVLRNIAKGITDEQMDKIKKSDSRLAGTYYGYKIYLQF
jgi:hypothetical protein